MNTDYTKEIEEIVLRIYHDGRTGNQRNAKRQIQSLQALLVRAEKSGRVDELKSLPPLILNNIQANTSEQYDKGVHFAYDTIKDRLATLQGGKCNCDQRAEGPGGTWTHHPTCPRAEDNNRQEEK